MRIFLQLTTCICLIILAGGTINYIHDDPTFGGGFILFIAWAAMGIIATTTTMATFESEQEQNKPEKPSSKRMNELERRLTDIQDVVISLDDQLKRHNRQPDADLIEKI